MRRAKVLLSLAAALLAVTASFALPQLAAAEVSSDASFAAGCQSRMSTGPAFGSSPNAPFFADSQRRGGPGIVTEIIFWDSGLSGPACCELAEGTCEVKCPCGYITSTCTTTSYGCRVTCYGCCQFPPI